MCNWQISEIIRNCSHCDIQTSEPLLHPLPTCHALPPPPPVALSTQMLLTSIPSYPLPTHFYNKYLLQTTWTKGGQCSSDLGRLQLPCRERIINTPREHTGRQHTAPHELNSFYSVLLTLHFINLFSSFQPLVFFYDGCGYGANHSQTKGCLDKSKNGGNLILRL